MNELIFETKIENVLVTKTVRVPVKVQLELSLEHTLFLYGLIAKTNGVIAWEIFKEFKGILGISGIRISEVFQQDAIDMNSQELNGLLGRLTKLENEIKSKYRTVNMENSDARPLCNEN